MRYKIETEDGKVQKNRKGQVAFEFVMLVGVLFLALLVFAAFARDNYSDTQDDADYHQLRDLALSVQTEIDAAATMEDGYNREFDVPATLDGTEYNVSQEGEYLTFQSDNAEYSIHTPPFTGMVVLGTNNISKDNGQIGVNT